MKRFIFRQMKEPTVQDIARLARVSLGTVSNVLNERSSVKEELVLRVNAAATKLGYRRNSNAASLRSNQTDMIAVVVPNIENAFFSEVVSAIEHRAIAERKGVMFMTTGEDQERAQRQIHNLISRRVDGLIIVPSFDFQPLLTDSTSMAFPSCSPTASKRRTRFPPLPSIICRRAISAASISSMRLSAFAFFNHGHRFWILDQRREGFLEAAKEAGTRNSAVLRIQSRS